MLNNTENIALRRLQILYILVLRGESYHFWAEIVAELAIFSSRNTNV